MNRIKWTSLLIVIITISSNCWALSPSDLCKEIAIIKEEKNNSNSMLGKLLKAIFLPKSVLELKEIETSTGLVQRQDDKDLHVFVNLTKKNDFINPSKTKEEARKFQKIKNQILNDEFYKKLLGKTSLAECLSEIDQEKASFERLSALMTSLKEALPYFEMQSRIEGQHYATQNLKKLKRKNWVIHEELYLEKFLEVLNGNPTDIIIIGHAFENGAIVDAEGKIIPSSVFSNTPSSLRNLIIFSCHSQKVIETYRINSLTKKGRFIFHYPMIRDSFSSTFGDSTPLLGIKSLTSYARNITSTGLPIVEEKECKLIFSHNPKDERLLVYLNNHLISRFTSSEIPFYCDLASETNVIRLVQIIKSNSMGDISLPENVTIFTERNKNTLPFKHFYNDGTYLGSKTHP